MGGIFDPMDMAEYLGKNLSEHMKEKQEFEKNSFKCASDALDGWFRSIITRCGGYVRISENAITFYGEDNTKQHILEDILKRIMVYIHKRDIYDTRTSDEEIQDVKLAFCMFGGYIIRRAITIGELRKIEDIVEEPLHNYLNGVYRIYDIHLFGDIVITYSYRHVDPSKICIIIFKNDIPIYYNYNNITVGTRDIINAIIDVIEKCIYREPDPHFGTCWDETLTDFEMNIFKDSIKNLKERVANIIELKSTIHDTPTTSLSITKRPRKCVTVGGKDYLYDVDIRENAELVLVLSEIKKDESGECFNKLSKTDKKSKFNPLEHIRKWVSFGGKK